MSFLYVNAGPQGRTEASCIVTDWVSQVKEEKKKNPQSLWILKQKNFQNKWHETSLPTQSAYPAGRKSNDPRLACDPITYMYVEGLKLINMYESYVHNMWHGNCIIFKMTFLTTVTLNDPRLTCDPIGKESHADQHVWVSWPYYVTWTKYSICSENDLLTPVTPDWHVTLIT